MRLVAVVALGLIGVLAAAVVLLLVSPTAGAVALGVILFGGAIVLLSASHAESTTYQCPNCGHHFKVNAMTDLLSPHTPSAKSLICPKCDKSVWAVKQPRDWI